MDFDTIDLLTYLLLFYSCFKALEVAQEWNNLRLRLGLGLG